ncbi:hypothetical protein COCOBI_08-4330 [Coccomyxa sp. Obi]|nr:hypothetical protein COCOBI_08-4330 [Coccomyxa sp. Obi]
MAKLLITGSSDDSSLMSSDDENVGFIWGTTALEEYANTLNSTAAFLLPQNPYARVIKNYTSPSPGCGGENVSEASLAKIQQEYGNGSLLIGDFAAKYYKALNATIWAYPLATMAETLPRHTYSPGNPPHFNINTFVNNPVMANYTITSVVSPNADTLYSVAWLDLTSGPLVIGVPDMEGRFYVLEFVDAYTNVPLTIGPASSPLGQGITRAVRYVITPPGFNGTVPPGYNYTARVETPLVWILGRTYADGYNETDLAAANALIAQYSISPLFPDGYQPPTAVSQLAEQALVASGVPYSIDSGRNVSAFWQMTGAMAALNPPATAADATAYAGFSGLGLTANGFNAAAVVDNDTALALNLGLAAGLLCINATARSLGNATAARWTSSSVAVLSSGQSSTDVLTRAALDWSVLGANPPSTAIYYTNYDGFKASDAATLAGPTLPLDGSAYDYTLSFTSFPNVTGFWSVTMYAADNNQFFNAPYDATDGAYRYNINAVTPGFAYNGGNFTIYMSVTPAPAGSLQQKNWLPIGTVPSSRFYLILRLYGPSQEAQAGEYDPPPILAHPRGFSAA